MVDDVDAAVAFYTGHLGFTLLSQAGPAFADVARDDLRLLLSGAASSAGRPMPDGRKPGPGGWNRIQLVVDDLQHELDRLREAGLKFRNDVVTGPGGSQILIEIRPATWSRFSSQRAESEAASLPRRRSEPGSGRSGRSMSSRSCCCGHASSCAELLLEVASPISTDSSRDHCSDSLPSSGCL